MYVLPRGFGKSTNYGCNQYSCLWDYKCAINGGFTGVQRFRRNPPFRLSHYIVKGRTKLDSKPYY